MSINVPMITTDLTGYRKTEKGKHYIVSIFRRFKSGTGVLTVLFGGSIRRFIIWVKVIMHDREL